MYCRRRRSTRPCAAADSSRRSSAPPEASPPADACGEGGGPRSVAERVRVRSDDDQGVAAKGRCPRRERCPLGAGAPRAPRHDAAVGGPGAALETAIGRYMTINRWRLPTWRRLTWEARPGGPRISALESSRRVQAIVAGFLPRGGSASALGGHSVRALQEKQFAASRHPVGRDGHRPRHRQWEAARSQAVRLPAAGAARVVPEAPDATSPTPGRGAKTSSRCSRIPRSCSAARWGRTGRRMGRSVTARFRAGDASDTGRVTGDLTAVSPTASLA